MRPNRKLLAAINGVCALAILGSLVAYAATGAYAFTRFRDKELEQANAQNELSGMFADTSDDQAEKKRVESVNAIGLMPSGPGLASVSVATIAAPAFVVMVASWWWGRNKLTKTHAPDTPENA